MKLKQPAIIACLCLFFLVSVSRAQNRTVVIPGNIKLPQDSVTNSLITALNGFLAQKEKPNKSNTAVLKDGFLETSALLDEMMGVEQNDAAKDANFYKPYLMNLVKQGNDVYAVQLSYIGTADSAPLLKATFSLLAKKEEGVFYFYSPLKQNTKGWRTKKAGHVTFKFKDTLGAADAKDFLKNVELLDGKLKANKPILQYYCDNFLEAQQLLGVGYKAEYAGVVNNNLTANSDEQSLIVNGWSSGQHRFDPHDLFHDRLRTVMSSDVINRPVDEGCAYLYGGSWGKSWAEVSTLFNVYVKENPDADWLQLYIDGKNYQNNGGKILKISYMINALIVQKLEKEKGFGAVMELLACGKKEPGDANYFKALEKLTGISKAGFNTEVGKLVRGN